MAPNCPSVVREWIAPGLSATRTLPVVVTSKPAVPGTAEYRVGHVPNRRTQPGMEYVPGNAPASRE